MHFKALSTIGCARLGAWKLYVCLTTLALAAWAVAQKDQVIVYDAAQAIFREDIRRLGPIGPRTRVTLKIIHPNSFRYGYSTDNFFNVDFHSAALPTELGQLLSVGDQQRTSSRAVDPSIRITATANPPLLEQAEALVDRLIPHTMPAEKELVSRGKRVLETYKKYGKLIDDLKLLTDQSAIGSNIEIAVRKGSTNAAIRYDCTKILVAFFGTLPDEYRDVLDHDVLRTITNGLTNRVPLPDDPDDPDFKDDVLLVLPMASKAVPAVLEVFKNRAADASSELANALAEWRSAYTIWKSEVSPNLQPIALLVADMFDKINAVGAANNTAWSAQITAIQPRYLLASGYYAIASDADQTPTMITSQSVGPNKDRLDVQVQVTRQTLTSAAAPPAQPNQNSGQSSGQAGSQKGLSLRGTNSGPPAAVQGPGFSQSLNMLSLPVQGRDVLDYSAGIVNTTLKQANYFADANGKLQQGASDQGNVGGGVFAHYYLTSGAFITPALTLGIMPATPSRYLAGLSLVSNPSGPNRIVLTYGAAAGMVNVLNGPLKDSSGSPVGAPNPITSSVMKYGQFWSLSFRFTIH